MEYLWAEWPALRKRINSHGRVLFMLDFDGTLAAISKTPHDVKLERETREILGRLCRSSAYKVAIISGRSVKNLKSYFRMKNIFYSGNHGLELAGRGLRLPARAKKAKKLEALVWLLGEKIKKNLKDIPGAFVEDKEYTLSVHYRNVHKKHYPELGRRLALLKKRYRDWPLLWRKGKKIWEVRPSVRWGKGEVAALLSRKFKRSLPVIIGDDVTDEDMFSALKNRAVTIRVGRSKRSSADYYLNSSKDVRKLLSEISCIQN